jgi:tetratricopeptide (TPR) repeat protein
LADAGAQARIQDLKRRIELDPGSRLFVSLAEEYRKSGRLAEALSTLQRGLLTHPNYLSAQVALGRAYLESGQVTEAIATFSRVLVADPGNLVSAKSLADIYLSRGESVEAIKKYKLYRALSGDRTVQDVIARLDRQLAPPPPPSSGATVAAPPPPEFLEAPAGPIRRSEATTVSDAGVRASEAPFDLSPLPFETPEVPSFSPQELFGAPAETAPLSPAAIPADASDLAATRAFRMSEILGRPQAAVKETPSGAGSEGESQGAEAAEPQGRTLADLYFAQGHYAEALRIYDELVAANPFDEELRRLRRDAEARLLPAGSASVAGAADPVFDRRLKRIRALRQWLSVLQAG